MNCSAPLPGDDDTPVRLDEEGRCWPDDGPVHLADSDGFPWLCWIALGVVGVAFALTVVVLIAGGA